MGISLKNIRDFLRDNRLKLKSQKSFKSEVNNLFTEEIAKIVLNGTDNKRFKWIVCKETYAYGTSKNTMQKNEEVKYSVKQYKNDNDVAGENTIEHKANWPKIFDYPHWILIIGGSESGKTIALPNLMNLKPNIDKTYLYVSN